MAPKNTTKECFVAFIDILGFKDMILADDGSGTSLKVIKKTIKESTEVINERKKNKSHPYAWWYDEFKIRTFSDCFCFSIPLQFKNNEKDYLQNFVSFYGWIMVFYNKLLNAGFLCRGGISQGWHYSSNSLIFSRALVEAYQIESKEAIYPIIMIHPTLTKYLVDKNFISEPYYQYMFSHDNTGRNFLNQFNSSIVDQLFFYRDEYKDLDKDTNIKNEWLSKVLEIIRDKSSQYIGTPPMDKYQWLKEFSEYNLNGSHSDKFKDGLFLNQAVI
jgi:hypothetical protein